MTPTWGQQVTEMSLDKSFRQVRGEKTALPLPSHHAACGGSLLLNPDLHFLPCHFRRLPLPPTSTSGLLMSLQGPSLNAAAWDLAHRPHGPHGYPQEPRSHLHQHAPTSPTGLPRPAPACRALSTSLAAGQGRQTLALTLVWPGEGPNLHTPVSSPAKWVS